MAYRRRAMLCTAIVMVNMPAWARAGEPVRADCRPYVTSTSRIAFIDDEHRRWYVRYWAGTCDGLSFFSCTSGKPYWNDAVSKILEAGPADQRDQLLNKACKLGQLIGFEWAKDNSIRCIHTSDADKFLAIWEGKGDAFQRLDRIEARAKAMLKCR